MAMRWSLHADIVMGRTYFHCGFESRPCAWNAGINNKKGTLAADAQNALDTGTIHPSGSTRVPGPSSAPDMWRDGVDIGCDDVRPDLVAFDEIGRASCRERVCQYVYISEVAASLKKTPNVILREANSKKTANN